jgi:hypothetical protein
MRFASYWIVQLVGGAAGALTRDQELINIHSSFPGTILSASNAYFQTFVDLPDRCASTPAGGIYFIQFLRDPSLSSL